MAIVRIESDADERLSDFRDIPDPDLLVRRGLFVAEGRLVVSRLLASPLDTRALLLTETALASLERADCQRRVPGLRRATGRHERCCRLQLPSRLPGHRCATSCAAIGMHWSKGARRLVMLERVGNVDNVGAIFRNAAAFGVDGVLLQADCADPLYRKAIRTSMAASLQIPYATVPWPDALSELGDAGWATIAMTPARDAPLLQHVAAAVADRPIALALGHEGDGLTDDAAKACTHRARIADGGWRGFRECGDGRRYCTLRSRR